MNEKFFKDIPFIAPRDFIRNDNIVGCSIYDIFIHCLYVYDKELNIRRYVCKCRLCGKYFIADYKDLINGNIKNCGCKKEKIPIVLYNGKKKLTTLFADNVNFKKSTYKIDLSSETIETILEKQKNIANKNRFIEDIRKNKIDDFQEISYNLIDNFIKTNFVFCDNVENNKKIKRSDFYKMYSNFILHLKKEDYKISKIYFFRILSNVYNIKFAKSNGIFYSKNIKPKELQN